ncbi:MAG: hypothetical protein WD688_20380 [Candidatus Binatia bacterium]
MIKPFVDLQELRRRIYRKVKAEKAWRFWGLYVHVTRAESLRLAYREAKAKRFEMMRNIRRFAMKQKGRRGCGWKRWSNETIYKEWGLVNNYTVQYFYRSPAKDIPIHSHPYHEMFYVLEG